jgi:Flp pilus assembly protein TadB
MDYVPAAGATILQLMVAAMERWSMEERRSKRRSKRLKKKQKDSQQGHGLWTHIGSTCDW